ncbi:MAG: hypothetical protein ACJA2B_001732 [Candidatus Endobugula sp.]|jgi:hypothetical protein
MKNNKIRVSLAFNFLSAVLAFVLWGGWAFYINNTSETRFVSATTQALASFGITFILVHMVTYIFHLLPVTPMRIALPAAISVSITGSGLVVAHTLAGTPRIFFTIAPALAVAFVFCVYTALKLHRATTDNKE